MRKPITTIKRNISIRLDGQELREASRQLNLIYAGKELIQLDEKCSKEHQDVHYALRRTKELDVLIDVFKDGSKKIRLTK
jgi:hypothetical protein